MLQPLVSKLGEHNIRRVSEIGRMGKVREVEKMRKVRRVEKMEKVREVEKAIRETR